MKVFFAGTPAFAVPVLEAVSGSFDICGVLTAPDKPHGRGNKVLFSPVKEKAAELGLRLFQSNSSDQGVIDEISDLSPEILVVAAYGKIFKESFLAIFPIGGINLHPSLLPKYRGPAPIPAMILAGDKEGGITVQRLALQMDAGDILAQRRFELNGNETTDFLTEKCSLEGAKMVVSVLERIRDGSETAVPQDGSLATYCKFIKKEQGLIDWRDTAVNIERKVRAYYSWPSAYTVFSGLKLSITEACVLEGNIDIPSSCGSVLGVDKQQGILVKTGMGILGVRRIQVQAKKEMDFKSFINGYKAILNTTLGE